MALVAIGVASGVGVDCGVGGGGDVGGVVGMVDVRKERGMSEDGDWAIACGKDGCRHIDQNAAEMIWAEVEGQRRTRAANMPTEQRAISALFEAWYRLKELGWREACYVPRDGRLCEFVECGSTGIHQGHADEKGRIWLHDDSDLWPSNPVLFRILQKRPVPHD